MSGFVDSNVVIRLLSGDDPDKSRRCLELFERAARGEIQLVLSEAVIAEVVYVLSSPKLYALARTEIAELLRPILENRGVMVEHKGWMLKALDLYERTNLDIEDCIFVEHVRRGKLDTIFSFDRGLDRVTDLRRREP